jgi:hypothetical protein
VSYKSFDIQLRVDKNVAVAAFSTPSENLVHNTNPRFAEISSNAARRSSGEEAAGRRRRNWATTTTTTAVAERLSNMDP